MSESQASILQFDNVTVSFSGERPALHKISFEVKPGETMILLGTAGAGKTVLLKTALGLVRASGGKVWAFGQDITRLDERDLFDVRVRMGILFQEGGLFDSMTVEENVAFPLLNQKKSQRMSPQQIHCRVKDSLKFVELDGTLQKFPAELSGGMRRRVGIARAMVTEPPLALFDSPTAGLDPITSHTIMTLIVKARDVRNVSTLIATHRYQDAQLMANFRYNPDTDAVEPAGNETGRPPPSTKFLVLKEGELVFLGTQEQIEASDDPYVRKFVKR